MQCGTFNNVSLILYACKIITSKDAVPEDLGRWMFIGTKVKQQVSVWRRYESLQMLTVSDLSASNDSINLITTSTNTNKHVFF